MGVLVLMLTAVWQRQGHTVFPGPALLIFTLIAWRPLLVRTRWTLAVLVSVVVAESLHLVLVPFVDPGLSTPIAIAAYQPVPVATMAAAWTLASRRPPTVAWAAGGGAALVFLVVSLLARPQNLLATDMTMFNLVIIATGAGVVVTGRRERAARAAQAHGEDVRGKVVAERLRIARDLHDVLAHHLTLVNAQSAVAEHLMDANPRAAATALKDITVHTRSALDELRATVGLLRQDGDTAPDPADGAGLALQPVPGLTQLDDLLAGVRSAGTTVALTVHGLPRALPLSGDHAAYRIVQESLTNATKHAPGAEVDVTIDWSPGRLDLCIENVPAPDPRRRRPGPGTGHGLIGMRERALVSGGTFHTERRPGGGFVVRATIPAEADDAGPDSAHVGQEAP